jgi:hypothetical protein
MTHYIDKLQGDPQFGRNFSLRMGAVCLAAVSLACFLNVGATLTVVVWFFASFALFVLFVVIACAPTSGPGATLLRVKLASLTWVVVVGLVVTLTGYTNWPSVLSYAPLAPRLNEIADKAMRREKPIGPMWVGWMRFSRIERTPTGGVRFYAEPGWGQPADLLFDPHDKAQGFNMWSATRIVPGWFAIEED